MSVIAAIVQARMGSTRLPGKVMKLLCGKPMLWHIITRLSYSKKIEKIIVATTDGQEDSVIIKLAREMGINFYSGSSEDVLDRYYQTAKTFNVDPIVRITADCPLIDPEIVDNIIDYYLTSKYDYVTNTLKPTMPDGLDTEVFSFKTLEKAWTEAKKPSEREHVTPYIRNHPETFKLGNYEYEIDQSGLRWCVDEEADFRFVSEVYRNLYRDREIFYMNDILKLLSKYPELNDINNNIKRNAGYINSIEADKKQGYII